MEKDAPVCSKCGKNCESMEEFTEYDVERDGCIICGDGGCFSCEPHRFIRGVERL